MSNIKDSLNRANASVIADAMRALQFGAVLRALAYFMFGKAGVLGYAYTGTAWHTIVLPDDAKAAKVNSVYARAGGATLGALALSADNTPGTGEYYVTPTGDITLLAADAWTALDISVTPYPGDIFELTLPVAANTATLPTALTAKGVILLTECEVLTGGTTGKNVVDVPGTAPAVTHAALNLAKTTVIFNAGDAVTSVRVKLLVAPAVNMDLVLQSATPALV